MRRNEVPNDDLDEPGGRCSSRPHPRGSSGSLDSTKVRQIVESATKGAKEFRRQQAEAQRKAAERNKGRRLGPLP